MKVGFIAGSFDVIHPGYILMFQEIKSKCDYLIVGLHSNPNKERNTKLKPILTLNERFLILNAIKYIDEIIPYETEMDLLSILKTKKIDIRFLGDDYQNSQYTGKNLPIEINFINRNHGWSTTKFKKMISDSLNTQNI
jgi:glycerol-3-phosphate cytidylyltransferase